MPPSISSKQEAHRPWRSPYVQPAPLSPTLCTKEMGVVCVTTGGFQFIRIWINRIPGFKVIQKSHSNLYNSACLIPNFVNLKELFLVFLFQINREVCHGFGSPQIWNAALKRCPAWRMFSPAEQSFGGGGIHQPDCTVTTVVVGGDLPRRRHTHGSVTAFPRLAALFNADW